MACLVHGYWPFSALIQSLSNFQAEITPGDSAPFLLNKTKKDLFDWAMENELFLAPVSDIEDLLGNKQLKSREFRVELDHPELGDSIMYPGLFVKMSQTPVTVRHRAPLIGEHTEYVCREILDLSDD